MLAKFAQRRRRRRYSVKVGATRNSVLQREWSRAICVSRCSVPLELFVEFVLPIEWIGFDRRELRRLSPLLRCCCCCIPVSKFPADRMIRFHFSLHSFRNRSIYLLSRKMARFYFSLFFFFFLFFPLQFREDYTACVVTIRDEIYCFHTPGEERRQKKQSPCMASRLSRRAVSVCRSS